jgi:hypothetical protein
LYQHSNTPETIRQKIIDQMSECRASQKIDIASLCEQFYEEYLKNFYQISADTTTITGGIMKTTNISL